jgi:hypothetical protein
MARDRDPLNFIQAMKEAITPAVPKSVTPPFSPPFPGNFVFRNPLVENVKDNYASEFHERLVRWINDFDASLDDQHEVGARLVSFGQTIIFHLEAIGYWNPSLIVFYGTTDDDDPVELIQHVSQISVLLMKLPRKDPSQPKIGFSARMDRTRAAADPVDDEKSEGLGNEGPPAMRSRDPDSTGGGIHGTGA